MGHPGAGDEVDEALVIGASPSTVWQALVDTDRRRRWWSYVELDPVVGGRFVERWRGAGGEHMLTSGSVVELLSDRLLRLTWSDENWPAETEVEITLADADPGTVVRIRHLGWRRLPDGERLAEEHRAGWRMHLSNLRDHVEGEAHHS